MGSQRIGVMHLQAREHPGLPEAGKEAQNCFSQASSEREYDTADTVSPDFWPLEL